MKEDTASDSFVAALRSELQERVTAEPHASQQRRGAASSRRWQVPAVTVATGIVVAAVSAVAVIGFRAPATVGASPSTSALSGAVPRLLVSPVAPTSVAGVGFEGRVVVDHGGCLSVNGAALVGLPGSKLNADGSFTLTNPGGGVKAVTLKVGDRFRLGGTRATRTDAWAARFLPAAADGCASNKFLLVFGG